MRSQMSKSRRNRRAGVEDRWYKTTYDEQKQPQRVESASYGKGKRWRARYVDDEGSEHVRGFERKVDAQRWIDSVTAAQVTGSYVDPRKGKVTFTSFYREWSTRQVWVPGTTRAMDLAVNSTTFGDVGLAELRPSHVETWVRAMLDSGLQPSTIRTRFNNVRSVLRAAIRDRMLAHDPAAAVALPRVRRADAAMVIPRSAQVGALMEKADDDFEAFVALCAFAGLRLGEAAALQVGDVDFLRREIRVRRQVQRANGHAVEIRAPKYGSERTIPAPQGLLDVVARHVAHWRPGTDPARWLFPGTGEHPWHQNSVGYRWRKTRETAGVPELRMHDLRHFYASGLIAAGCDVVTVQKALGHHSATVTLNTYSHLWPDASDRTRKAADALFSASVGPAADALRTDDPVQAADQQL
ncbi:MULTISPECIES: site-specific integrase [Rhodococcus]|uniref:tyrosine-type recombinase/integrase n=1 Tax=Rhodococcus TaxID=1827 RepID=UPI001C63FBD0|nr:MULTISPECIES: site-specific integrase [Rhodococcus]WKX00243.1 tyrosine-type recombinase/integrase [Rhodococcus aetherivorans]